jgi:acyl dehydratase
MDFDLAHLGRWTDDRQFVVTRDATIAYAAATNDTLPEHTSGAVAPPMFAVVPALMGVATDAMDGIWVSKLPGDYDTRSLHGEQSLYVHEPIVPGMTLRSRAAPVGLERKSTGTLMMTRTETRDERDRVLNTMTFVNFLRGIHIEESVGEPAPSLDPPAAPDDSRPSAAITYRVDPDQTFRYAEASGDMGTYHIDDSVAREAGFPGVIVHGLCTMAFAARAIVESGCAGDSRRLRRLGVRFTRPLLPDQAITIRVAGAGERDGRSLYTFEVDDESGEGVIRRGIAEVSS